MNNLPKISIITPSYNQGKFIEQTIQSVLSQNYPNLEYIIIDGGSTDNTLEIIKKYEDKIAYWVSEPDNGQADAINKGLERATGEIVNWLNSDDILLPNALNTIVEEFTNNPYASFIYGDTNQINENGEIIYTVKVVNFKKNVLLYGRILGVQPSIFFRKNVWKKLGFLDEKYKFCMDIEYWIRAAMNNLVFSPVYKTIASNRFHPYTKTIKNQDLLQSEHFGILKNLNIFFTKLPKPVNLYFYEILRNFYRYIWGIQRLLTRRDFGINRSSKIRKLALK